MTDKRKKIFTDILYSYGRYIFSRIFKYALDKERYEDCNLMKKIATDKGFSLDCSKDDWIASFWRLNYSGEVASGNEEAYYIDALVLAGYI